MPFVVKCHKGVISTVLSSFKTRQEKGIGRMFLLTSLSQSGQAAGKLRKLLEWSPTPPTSFLVLMPFPGIFRTPPRCLGQYRQCSFQNTYHATKTYLPRNFQIVTATNQQCPVHLSFLFNESLMESPRRPTGNIVDWKPYAKLWETASLWVELRNNFLRMYTWSFVLRKQRWL